MNPNKTVDNSVTATNPSTALEYSLHHLQAELARIDLIFQRQLQRVPPASQDGKMGGLVITEQEMAQLFQADRQLSAGNLPEWAAAFADAQGVSSQIVAEAEALGFAPRLEALYRSFRLTDFERDAFLACLAPALDLRYERFFGYVQDDVTVRRPTASLILDLLADGEAARLQFLPLLFDEGRLLHHRLLRPVEAGEGTPVLGRQLAVDRCVFAWLLGVYEPDERLEPYLRLRTGEIGDEEQLLTAEVWPGLTAAINGQSVAFFHGEDEGIQEATARLLATSNRLPLLRLDLAPALKTGIGPVEAVRLALRDAHLIGALLYIQGWDATALTAGHPELLTLIFSSAYPVVVTSEKEWYAGGTRRSDAVMRIAFQRPGFRQRLALWDFYLDQLEHEIEPELDLQSLASQFGLSSGQIADAVISARDSALQRGGAIGERDLIDAARAHSSPNLSGLARKIEPRYEWGDLVIPPDQTEMLRELVQTVKGRGVVMEEWGVGRKLKTSAGVTVLFAGPPGTGKTMAAEVISRELGLDLYKLDLSMVVSKYIGETEKNLGKIFDEAQSSSAVLFFDEADAIFGKRSEVKDSHDRYANMEVSYLLQRMELYDGVTILATNLRSNMDEAFTRRMQFIVDFPFPEEEERLQIWRTLFPAEVPQADDIDLVLLAERFKLAGGNIRNVIAGAAFLAAANGGEVSMAHLLHSTRRELQKMGRLISDMDLTY